jgi:NADH-quinone oxidoreductase subunit G
MIDILRAGPASIASLADIESCDAVLVLGEDLTNTAPRLALALRQAARGAERELATQKGVPPWLDQAVRIAGEGRRSPIVLATPLPDALDPLATQALRLDPLDIAELGFEVAAALGGNAGSDEAAAIAQLLSNAQRPLIIGGFGLGAAETLEAAAAIAAALGAKARIALVAPEANSVGLALLGGDGIDSAVTALTSGAARHALVLENDLFERAPRDSVERLFAAAGSVIAFDNLQTETTQRADLVLPVASFTESAGSFVNYEGRAQRFFAAVAPRADAPASWRRLAALGAGDWTALDQLIDAIIAERADLAGLKGAAPEASCRCAHGDVARTPRPLSGHTADDRAGRDPLATPPADPDSPLSFGMEGARGRELPPALLTGYETPGLHSANAVTRFTEEINGPLRGGDPGARLIVPGHAVSNTASAFTEAEGEGLLLVPLHDVFSGSEIGRASKLLAARAPAPRLLLHPDDAEMLGLAEGDALLVDGERCVAPLTLEPNMARGVVALSLGTLMPRGPLRRVRVEAAR